MFDLTVFGIVAILACGFLLGAGLLYDGLRGMCRALTCTEGDDVHAEDASQE